MRIHSRYLFLSSVLLGLVAAGCDGAGDSDDTDTDSTAAPPAFGVVSVPTSTDGTSTSYVVLSDTLTSGIDPADAVLELPGRAVAASPAGSGQVFIGTSEGSELVRYDHVDGGLVESGRANFAAQQVTAFAGYSAQLQFVDDDTAYWFGRDGRIVVWNPTELTVDRAIELPGTLREDPNNPGNNYTTSVTAAPVWNGDELISFVSWDSRTGGVITVPGAYGVVVVDTTTDEAEFYADEAGCGYGRDGVIDGEWLYIATEAVGTSVHYLDPENGPAPCLRRFNLTTKEFDADFQVDLNALAGGPAGSLVTTLDGQALIHVLDDEQAAPLVADETITNPRVLSSADLWHTAVLNVGDDPTIDVLDVPLRSASVLPATVNGMRVTPTFGDTPQILEITADGIEATSETGAEVTGFTSSVFYLD